MKGLLKVSGGLLTAVICLASFRLEANAATGIYVGSEVSTEGTTVIGVSDEGDVGISCVPVVLEKGLYKKGDAIEFANGYKYTLPEDSAKLVIKRAMAYTDFAGANCCASNEYGVSVIGCSLLASNDAAAAADPFADDGVYTDKVELAVASTAKTAEDAVKILGSMIDENGACCGMAFLITDPDGAWAFENYSGHQYAALKLPADRVGTFGNEPIIKKAAMDDENMIFSSELFSLPEDNGFAVYEDKTLDLAGTYIDKELNFTSEDHLRGWIGHDLFAPSEGLSYDEDADYDTFFAPDDKLGMEDVFDFFRNRYEGTDFDLSDEDNLTSYFGINNQSVTSANVLQVFPDVPAEMSTVLWTTPANPTASPFIPIPVLTAALPENLSTDVEDDAFVDGILQFEFAKLNNSIIPRREAYGRSVREYWEGMESLSAADVAASLRGKWKDAYDQSPEKAAEEITSYVNDIAAAAGENCERISEEFDWYLFKNGIIVNSVPDDLVTPFECSFDAISYATMNGWDTEVADDIFTATKDGKTIEVVLDGDDKGAVTFTGFDTEKLMEDFIAGNTEEIDLDELFAEEDEEAIEAAEEEAAEEEAAEPEEEEEESAPADEAKEAAEPEEAEEADVAEMTRTAAEQLEVDTIAELSQYFNEKIASVPRDGWSENEIAVQLGEVSNDVVAIFGRHFSGDIEDVESLMNYDYEKLGNDIASDPALAEVGEKVALAGLDLAELSERYFNSLVEDVVSDVESGRINEQGVEKILMEAETDIEGIATIYLEGVQGAFSEVFDTSLSQEELTELVDELGAAAEVLDEMGYIDLDSLGLGDVDLSKLSEAEVNVVVTLDGMDDDIINGLSELLGVDVRATLDMYMDAINSAGSPVTVVEEKHESEKAESAPDEEVMTLIDLQEELTEDDIVIPQEVIDILNEAIYGSAVGEGAAEAEEPAAPAEEPAPKEDAAPAEPAPADDGAGAADEAPAAVEAEEPATEEASAAEPAEEAETETETAPEEDGSVRINVEGVVKSGSRVLLPAYLLKYFI
ncbi:MAG: C69 family dipeptidase [Lachnospiraceae bacterium]|nr:C69 family dipeptidase [Lachnospiraceae bacterium]